MPDVKQANWAEPTVMPGRFKVNPCFGGWQVIDLEHDGGYTDSIVAQFSEQYVDARDYAEDFCRRLNAGPFAKREDDPQPA